MTQYMLAIGLNNEQVGLISSIGLIFGMFLSLFAGFITDRIGRRWSLLIFDLLSWSLGCLLWSLAQNYAWFLAAGLANAFIRMVTVPYNCILIEDTPPENRLSVFSVLNLAAILANFCAPLMNLFINPLGLVPAMRAVLIFSSVIYCVMFVVRHCFFKDTEIAVQRKVESRNDTPFSAIIAYKRIFKELFHSRILLILLLMRTLYLVQSNLRNTYLSVAVVQGFGFQITTMSLVSIITGAVSFVTQLLIVPKLINTRVHKPLSYAFSIGILSNILLFITPANNLFYLIITIIINAAGLIVIYMLAETHMANAIPNTDRAYLMALTSVITVLLSAPFQYLGGLLADIPDIGPRLPLLIIITLMLAGLVLSLCLRKQVGYEKHEYQ